MAAVSWACWFGGPATAVPASRNPLEVGSRALETGEFEAAIAALTEAIDRDDSQVRPYALRAYAERQLGQYQSALEDYSAILQRQPNSATTYVDRGLLKGMLGNSEGAIADHTRAISLEPADPRAYSSRGIARCISGDTKGGEQDLRQSGILSLNRGDYSLYRIALQSEKQFCR